MTKPKIARSTASENIRAGDYCRPILGGKVRLLQNGDSLRASDVIALHDAREDESVQVMLIDPDHVGLEML